jgi:glycosyltransferase involved in cell wall biosynthesis
MDDWPSTINKPGLLYSYWKKRTDISFKKLMDEASVLLSIGDAMSEEYKRRYNKDFVPFHNPIEIENWLPFSRKNWETRDRFTILYAGRLGNGVNNSIADIARAVNSLCSSNTNIVFELQTPDPAALQKIVQLNENIKWVRPLDYSRLPEKFASVDMLVIPFDFDENSLTFLRYSFSTKIPEYMISGTPVLVYADKQTALARYAMKEKWAHVVTENNPEKLKEAIREMYHNSSLRKEYAERAKKIAIRNDSAEVVRENFRKCLSLSL